MRVIIVITAQPGSRQDLINALATLTAKLLFIDDKFVGQTVVPAMVAGSFYKCGILGHILNLSGFKNEV